MLRLIMTQNTKLLQEWNGKAEEDKKRYERELTKWKAEGGDEAIKAAKKQAKKEKRAAAESGKASSKPSKAKPEAPKVLSTSAGTGTSYKSKEYIESSEGSSSQKRGPYKTYGFALLICTLQNPYTQTQLNKRT